MNFFFFFIQGSPNSPVCYDSHFPGLAQEMKRQSNEADFHVCYMETRLRDSTVSAALSSHVPGQLRYLIDCWSFLWVQNSKQFTKCPSRYFTGKKRQGCFLGFSYDRKRHKGDTQLCQVLITWHTQRLIHPSLMWGIIRPSQTSFGFLWAARETAVGYFQAIKK